MAKDKSKKSLFAKTTDTADTVTCDSSSLREELERNLSIKHPLADFITNLSPAANTLAISHDYANAYDTAMREARERAAYASINTASSNPLGYNPYGCYSEGPATNPYHIRMLEEVHAAICSHLSPAESIAELTHAIDSIECPVADCKSCKYFNPGGVDFCNTSLRIADFLVLNGIVKVFHVPDLDKTE